MEVGGLTVGVLALAGLFNNAVDCFEYVQLGRNFGKNFQTSLLKLDNARLRLSRWGQSVGMSGDLNDLQSLNQTLGSAQDKGKAEGILGQILELFAEAEGVSSKIKCRVKPNDATLIVYDPQTDLEPMTATLHQKMRELCIKRQNRTGLRQKAKWALYEEKHFRRLIEDVTDLVNDLVDLFPAAQASQRALCEIEVSELGTEESLPVLKEIAASQDKYLEAAIAKVVEDRKGNSYSVTFSGNNNSGFQVAHNSGAISNLRWGGST
jgi:hypothetical protein